MAPPKKEREKKRDLIRWDDDKDTQILLGLQAHCMKRGIKLPWDDVARGIGPKVTGNAVIQHLAKIRKRREIDGLPVPGVGNRRKSLKRGASEDSDDQGADGGGGKSDDSYEGPAAKSARRRPSKAIKQERTSSVGSARAKNAKAASAAKAKKDLAVKQEDVSPKGFEEESSDEDSVAGELVAPGQPFLQFDNFEEDSDSDTRLGGVKSNAENNSAQKKVTGTHKPTKVVTLQYNKNRVVTEQEQSGPMLPLTPYPPTQPAGGHFDGWSDLWGLNSAARFNPMQYGPNIIAQPYGYGHPPQMMSSMSFPPTFAPHGHYPPMVDQRETYGQGSRDASMPSHFTAANLQSMPFGLAEPAHQYHYLSQPLPQTLPPMDWDHSMEATARSMGDFQRPEDEVKPEQVVAEQSARENSNDSSESRSSSVASSGPDFDNLEIH